MCIRDRPCARWIQSSADWMYGRVWEILNGGKTTPVSYTHLLGLRVVALPGAGDKARLCYLDFQMVVFVATITRRWIERQLVICFGVGQACVQELSLIHI